MVFTVKDLAIISMILDASYPLVICKTPALRSIQSGTSLRVNPEDIISFCSCMTKRPVLIVDLLQLPHIILSSGYDANVPMRVISFALRYLVFYSSQCFFLSIEACF